jgi:hypothetical protein
MYVHAYRAYELSEDGHVISRRDLPYYLNDETAKTHARQLVDGHTIELWDGALLIERFEPRD